MSASDRFERDFGAVLADLAEPHYPDYFDDVLDRALRRPQRPAWTFLERWLPMSAIALRQPFGMPRLWRTVGILALLLVMLAAALLAVGAFHRVPPPWGLAANGAITYTRDGDVYVRATAMSPERLVVSGPETDVYSQYSRDGTSLVFVRLLESDPNAKETLMLANPDGSNVRPLLATQVLQSFAWSPDGRELAVVATIRSKQTLLIVPVDGSGPRTIESDVVPGAWVDWRPPDGRQILFLGRTKAGHNSWGIWMLEVGGTTPVRVSPSGTEDEWLGPFALSPDGRHLAATGWIDNALSQKEVDLDKRTVSRMFDSLPPPAADAGSGPVHSGHAVYSPDGSVVIFGRYWDEHDNTINHQLWIASTAGDGDDARPITPVTRSQSGVGPFGALYAPDATRVMIQVYPSKSTYLLDPHAGTTEPVDLESNDLPGWQRLAR